jgi:hypothetical protein
MSQLHELQGRKDPNTNGFTVEKPVLRKLAELPSQVQQIRNDLKALFKNLPSNSAATHQGGNSFCIKQPDMVDGIISPDYYHFESQHKVLDDLIQTYPLDSMRDKLLEVCKTGKIIRSYNNRTLLHPTVLTFVREACGYGVIK